MKRPSERFSERPSQDRKKKPFLRRKVCRFCTDKKLDIDYKNPKILRFFITERGRSFPEGSPEIVRSTREK